MSIRPDKKYHGTVAIGSCLIESQNGTMGYQLQLDCEDGQAEYMIWLTAKNKDRARAAFVDILGVKEDKLQDANYFEYMLAEEITGRPITFTTVENEYKGKRKVQVAFIFKPGSWALDGAGPGRAAAAFFGAEVKAPKIDDDDDMPF